MIDVVERVDVVAPAAVVWAAVTDWHNQGVWMLGTRVRVTSGDGRLGSRLAARTAVGPLRFTDRMEITRWEPPVACEVAHVGRLVRGTGGFRVEPRGVSRSTLVWWERLVPPLGPLGAVAWRLTGPAFRLGVRHSLRRFADFAESRV
ncbi:SRPBCC family protein [Actinokineospora sp. UTMC 2448]|uniref:SRPBCC family protein n=1 Tax=Actinokineospora sp. UTMC 2448 TaxID=2268449 RepID=UPI002164C147|nr:SRPBCC family protein [Actinokineospora sp. UTMC 2448]UVS77111.1 Polyketide cyclase / dehydrase and lipid transport [Actinokineospora sp. UTMC 2448]